MNKGKSIFALAACLATSTMAQAEAPPLSAYGNLPAVERGALSPSGKAVALLTSVNGERVVTVIEDGKEPRYIARVGNEKVRQLAWAGDDTVLVMLSTALTLGPQFTANKYELPQLIIIPATGGKQRVLFDQSRSMAKVVQGTYGRRQIDGRWMGFFGGINTAVVREPRASGYISLTPNLMRVDLGENTAVSIANPAPQGHSRHWLVDAAGRVAATLDIEQSSGSWTIVNGSGAVIARGRNPAGDIQLVSLGSLGSSAIYATGKNRSEDEPGTEDSPAPLRFFEVPLAGGTPAEIIRSGNNVQLFIDDTTGALIGYVELGVSRKAHFFDPAKQAAYEKTIRAFRGKRVDFADFTSDFQTLLVHTSGDHDSGSWYRVNVASRQATLAGNDRPSIPADAIGPVSTIDYKAADGLAMNAILTLPPGKTAKDLPVVVLPHDGPAGHDEPVFDWRAQAFSSRGYAVLQPNFRGSDNLDQAFQEAGNGQWGRSMQTDLSDGLAELARRGIVDPKRACIVGSGYGGYAALAGVTLQHGIYRCAVAVAPISDLGEMYATGNRIQPDNEVERRSRLQYLGNPSTFAAVSPRKHARDADAPVLLIHGKDDTVVPLRQSTAMADALKDAGKPYELVVMPGEDHWLSRSASRLQMLEASVAFVQKHNPAN